MKIVALMPGPEGDVSPVSLFDPSDEHRGGYVLGTIYR
jgi:hypothetical protein